MLLLYQFSNMLLRKMALLKLTSLLRMIKMLVKIHKINDFIFLDFLRYVFCFTVNTLESSSATFSQFSFFGICCPWWQSILDCFKVNDNDDGDQNHKNVESGNGCFFLSTLTANHCFCLLFCLSAKLGQPAATSQQCKWEWLKTENNKRNKNKSKWPCKTVIWSKHVVRW